MIILLSIVTNVWPVGSLEVALLLQLGVFGLGLHQDGNVGVGIFGGITILNRHYHKSPEKWFSHFVREVM